MKYEYWFSGIRNIPDRTKIKLKEKAGTAEAIYYIEETALRKMQLLKEQEIWKLLEAKKKEELELLLCNNLFIFLVLSNNCTLIRLLQTQLYIQLVPIQ